MSNSEEPKPTAPVSEPPRRKAWAVWLDRLISLGAIAMIAWVLGRYLMPMPGERIAGDPVSFLPAGQPALVEFSQTH